MRAPHGRETCRAVFFRRQASGGGGAAGGRFRRLQGIQGELPVAVSGGCQASESLKLTIKDRNGDIRERKTLRRK